MREAAKILFIFFILIDMENGEKVSKQGYLCPQDSKGGTYPQDSAGGGLLNPNNPPPQYTHLNLMSLTGGGNNLDIFEHVD